MAHPTESVTEIDELSYDMGRHALGTPEDVSILGIVNAVLRRRWVILTAVIGVTALLVGFALVRKRVSISTSSFMPEQQRASTSLSGIASQFGLSIPSQQGSESPQFYVDLLRSPDILGAAVDTKYAVRSDTGIVSETLVNVYHPRGETAPLRRETAIKRLDDALTTSVSAKTNVVTVSIAAPNPTLARDVNARLIGLLNEFNLNRRQSGARAERIFADQRVADVTEQLRVAENKLQSFLESNREYRNSPALQFQQDRLQADMTFRRTLLTALEQQAEQAKMEEVRNTPVITVVEAPDVPVRPASRGIVKFGLLGIFLGLVLGLCVAFAQEIVSDSRTRESSEFEEFKDLRRKAVSEVLHPWRAIAMRRRSRQRN